MDTGNDDDERTDHLPRCVATSTRTLAAPHYHQVDSTIASLATKLGLVGYCVTLYDTLCSPPENSDGAMMVDWSMAFLTAPFAFASNPYWASPLGAQHLYVLSGLVVATPLVDGLW